MPVLRNHSSFKEIESFFIAIEGITQVRIEPLIQTMIVEYDSTIISKQRICHYTSLFFRHESLDPFDPLFVNVSPGIRKAIFRSIITGVLIIGAFIKRRYTSKIDVFDYVVVISTAYTVLTHGGDNRYRHPDILTGIISLFSLGIHNLLQVCAVTWGVNVLELLNDIKRANQSPNLL